MANPRYNAVLHDIAMAAINDSLGSVSEKEAFVPPPPAPAGGGGDPMAAMMGGAGGGLPPDPALMAAAGGGGGGGMPDPAAMMAGGPPPMDPGMMDPAMLGGPPVDPAAAGGGGAPPEESVRDQIKDVLEETGVIKAPKMKPEVRMDYLETLLKGIMTHMGIDIPDPPTGESEGGGEGGGGEDAQVPQGSVGAAPSGDAAPTMGMTAGSTGAASSMDLGSIASPPLDGTKQAAVNPGSQLKRTLTRLRTNPGG